MLICIFNPIKDSFFCSFLRMGVPKSLPSLKSVTHPAMVNLKPKKYMNQLTHPLRSLDICIFTREIKKLCYIKEYRYRLQFDT